MATEPQKGQMSPELVLVAGPSRGARIALEADEVVLGRASSLEIPARIARNLLSPASGARHR